MSDIVVAPVVAPAATVAFVATPVSDADKRALDAQLSAIRSKHGQANFTATLQGMELGIGARYGTRFGEVSTSGFVSRMWGTGGWSTGFRAGLAF